MKTLTTILGVILCTMYTYSQPTWTAQNSGVTKYLFDIHFADPLNGWAAGNTGLILHTTDGGATWAPQDPPPNNTYYSLYFTDVLNGWATGYAGKLIHTNNGGETWTDQNSGLDTYIYNVCFVDENNGWAVGGDNGTFPSNIKHREIIHTSNGGQTWIPQLSTTDESLLKGVHFIDENNGAAVGESGAILFTSNGGTTWDEKMSDNSYHFYSVFLTDPANAYVVGVFLGLPHVSVIFRTEDGGETWTNQTFNEDETLSDIYFTDAEHGWAVGGTNNTAAILYTADGGDNWEYVDAGTDRSLSCVYFVDNDHGWAAGFMGAIVSTSISTGLPVERESAHLNVFPNPASDVLYIDYSEIDDQPVDLRLINSTGQIVFQQQGVSQASGILSVNTRDMAKGLYTLVIEKLTGVDTKKVLISN